MSFSETIMAASPLHVVPGYQYLQQRKNQDFSWNTYDVDLARDQQQLDGKRLMPSNTLNDKDAHNPSTIILAIYYIIKSFPSGV